MFFPYNVDVPMRRWPIANWVLIGITFVLAVAFLSDPEAGMYTFVLWRGEEFAFVQLVGNLFGHADILHLLGNLLFLFVFGNAVNAKLGNIAFPILYFAIGILESLVWLALGSEGATLGASGAIMGIVGAFLVLYPRNDVSVFYWFFLIAMGTVRISAYWIIALYIAFDLWGFATSGEAAVNYTAHLAGAAIGIGAAWALVAFGIVKPDRAEQTLVDIFRSRHKKARHPSEPVRRAGPPLPVPRSPGPDLSSIPLYDESEFPDNRAGKRRGPPSPSTPKPPPRRQGK